MQDKDVVTVEG